MNLLSIAFKSIRQRALASSLTALSVALGTSLMIAVLIANTIVSRAFDLQQFGYDLVVGPKGSELDLVLNAVYRMAPPIENLPWRYYEEIKANKHIEVAIPVALGDSSEVGGFPILGTTVEYFAVEYAQGKKYRVNGKWPARTWDSVIGSHVAKVNGWKVGDPFHMVHAGQDDQVHEEKFLIVGILEATGTPDDRTVFVNLNGFFAIDGHEKPIGEAIAREADFFGESEEEVREYHAKELAEFEQAASKNNLESDTGQHDHHSDKIPMIQKEVTSILVRMKFDPKNPTLAQSRAIGFSAKLKEGFKAQAVNPIRPMQRIMKNLVGNIRLVLMYLTGLIIFVSGVSIFVSIYNSMADRKKEIAIMRALGADRMTVFSIILIESVTLCVAGGLAGIALGHGLIMLAGPVVAARSGLLIDPMIFDPQELIVIPAMIVLASLVGFIPGLTAYRTDVADNLHS